MRVWVQLMGSSVERSPEDHLSQTRRSNSHSQGSLMDQTGNPQWAEAHSGLSYSITASEVHLPRCSPCIQMDAHLSVPCKSEEPPSDVRKHAMFSPKQQCGIGS